MSEGSMSDVDEPFNDVGDDTDEVALPDHAADYVAPSALPKSGHTKTFEMETVKLAPDVDPRRAVTERKLRSPKRPDSEAPPSSGAPQTLPGRSKKGRLIVALSLGAALALLVFAFIKLSGSDPASSAATTEPAPTKPPATQAKPAATAEPTKTSEPAKAEPEPSKTAEPLESAEPVKTAEPKPTPLKPAAPESTAPAAARKPAPVATDKPAAPAGSQKSDPDRPFF